MDEEVALPRATLNKMIRDALPGDMRLSSDCNDKMIECCEEFISLIASEANEVSSKDGKSTILPEHVVSALGELQFHDFVGPVQEVWQKYKAENKHGEKKLSKKSGADKAGMSEEEQIALQQKMFAAARARSMGESQLGAAAAAANAASNNPSGGNE
eukprot:scaffold52609_cov47-Prasinocladus_malaysianus.AAC.4